MVTYSWFQALGSCCEAVQRQNLGSGRSWGQEQGGGAGYLTDGAPSLSAVCSLAVLTAEPAPAQLQVLFPPGDRPGALLPHPASSASAAGSSRGRCGRLSSRTGAQTLGSCSSWGGKLQTKKFCSRAILLQAVHTPGSPQPPCRNPIPAVLAGQPHRWASCTPHGFTAPHPCPLWGSQKPCEQRNIYNKHG